MSIIAIVLFFISVVIGFIYNRKKEKGFEANLPDDVLKTKKLYKGSLTRYVNNDEGKTILRYFVSKKTNTLTDFVPDDEILVNNCLVLFDKKREKIAIIKDIREHGVTKLIRFSDVISLQPVEISKNKKVTRGGICPIAIGGYTWASSTTKMLKEIERVYIEMKYRAYDKEQIFEISIFDGISYSDRNKYSKILDETNTVINKFHTVIAHEV